MERQQIEVASGSLDVFVTGRVAPGASIVCAAHPAGVFGESAATLMQETAEAIAVRINPRGMGGSSRRPLDR